MLKNDDIKNKNLGISTENMSLNLDWLIFSIIVLNGSLISPLKEYPKMESTITS